MSYNYYNIKCLNGVIGPPKGRYLVLLWLDIKPCISIQFVLICVNHVNNKEKAKYYKKEPAS